MRLAPSPAIVRTVTKPDAARSLPDQTAFGNVCILEVSGKLPAAENVG